MVRVDVNVECARCCLELEEIRVVRLGSPGVLISVMILRGYFTCLCVVVVEVEHAGCGRYCLDLELHTYSPCMCGNGMAHPTPAVNTPCFTVRISVVLAGDL